MQVFFVDKPGMDKVDREPDWVPVVQVADRGMARFAGNPRNSAVQDKRKEQVLAVQDSLVELKVQVPVVQGRLGER